MKVKLNNEIHQQELNMILEVEKIAQKHNLKYYLAYGTVLGAIRDNGFIPWDTDIDIIVKSDDYEQFCKIMKDELSSEFKIEHTTFDNDYDSLKARVSMKGKSNLLIHIDVFPIVGVPNSKFGKWIFTKIAYFNYRLYFFKKLNPELNYKNDKMKKVIAKSLKIVLFPLPINLLFMMNNKLRMMYPVNEAEEVMNLCGSYGNKEIIPKNWLGNPVYKKFEGFELPVPKEYHKYLKHIYGDYMTPKKENYI